jgi:hypothetical protein
VATSSSSLYTAYQSAKSEIAIAKRKKYAKREV